MRTADLSVAAAVLDKAVGERVFPGASYSIAFQGDVLSGAVGRFTFDEDAKTVTSDTIYDVASLTKVLATTAMAMLLYERGQLRLDQPVADILSEFAASTEHPRRRNVTVGMLLAHSSGLPAYEKLFLRANGTREILRAACAVPLAVDPGTRAEYSDVGFILLGEALERIADEPLDSFCAREVFKPLDMIDTFFQPRSALYTRIPPTEDDREYRHKTICGEVNDENAWSMDGVAGHAGLFSTAEDIAEFAACMLRGGAPVFHGETIELFTRRESTTPGTSRALGWDTPSRPSSSGQYFGPRSFGHLGFTGTSLWIDPDRELAITLLTNRTWPNRGSQEGIRRVRPAFHDAVVEAIGV